MLGSIDSHSVRQAQTDRSKPEDLFKKMDSDGDGNVSKDEFESAIVQISQQGAQAADGTDGAALKASADAIYARLDTDGNGQLSSAEFTAAAPAPEGRGNQGPPGGPPPGGGGKPSSGPDGKNYDPADTNKDGTVSAEEAAAYEVQQAVKTYSEVAQAS